MRTPRRSNCTTKISSVSRHAGNRTALPPSRFATCSKPLSAIAQTEFCWEKSESGEAFDLLQLLNTGHSGTLSTIHASSAKQGLARFTSCVLQSGVELPYRAVKTNIGDSLNVVVQIERRPGRRFISEVLEIKSYDPDADLFDFCAIYLAPRDNS